MNKHCLINKVKKELEHSNVFIPGNSCPFALCRCKAPKLADIIFYFKPIATKQMCKDNGRHYPKIGLIKKGIAVGQKVY
jgi:hypothetical protein